MEYRNNTFALYPTMDKSDNLSIRKYSRSVKYKKAYKLLLKVGTKIIDTCNLFVVALNMPSLYRAGALFVDASDVDVHLTTIYYYPA